MIDWKTARGAVYKEVAESTLEYNKQVSLYQIVRPEASERELLIHQINLQIAAQKQSMQMYLYLGTLIGAFMDELKEGRADA
jgi:hypothetical protein